MSAPLTPQTAAACAKGDALPSLTVQVTRADLVRYAGASGDLNPIHWSDRVAAVAGLPGVIAHGMLSMALAGRVLTAWTGVDHAFCLALVEPRIAAEVRAELQRIAALPPRLSDALKAQAMQLVQGGSA